MSYNLLFDNQPTHISSFRVHFKPHTLPSRLPEAKSPSQLPRAQSVFEIQAWVNQDLKLVSVTGRVTGIPLQGAEGRLRILWYGGRSFCLPVVLAASWKTRNLKSSLAFKTLTSAVLSSEGMWEAGDGAEASLYLNPSLPTVLWCTMGKNSNGNISEIFPIQLLARISSHGDQKMYLDLSKISNYKKSVSLLHFNFTARHSASVTKM